MPLDRPEAGYVWLHVPRREPVEVVVCSDICTWWAHFVRVPGSKAAKAVRCVKADGFECEWCGAQVGSRARYVFAARVAENLRLVELGRVQFPALQVFYQSDRWLGTRLILRREWDAANARIEVAFRGREALSEELVVDIADHVAGLGLAERRTLKPPAAPVPAVSPSQTSGSAGGHPQGVANRWRDRAQ